MNKDDKIEVHQIRIFTNEAGRFGSPLGLIVDEQRGLDDSRRIEIAKQLGYSETVFINNLSLRDVSIFSQQGEIKFASPLLGAAWFIQEGTSESVNSLICQGAKLNILNKDGLIWLELKNPKILPPWQLDEMSDLKSVGNLRASEIPDDAHVLKWAWIDESHNPGMVRARTFAPAWEILEEEANGSGSMKLAIHLNRDLIVKHGEGSIINVIKLSSGVAVGGLVSYDKNFTI